jgi:hypothetical protein
MSLAEIAAVAAILGNGTNIVDKIYTRFFERKTGTPVPADHLPENSLVISNDPAQCALVVTKGGRELSKVTYDQLEKRLSAADFEYITFREGIMKQLYEQWKAGYAELPTEMDPIRKKQLEQRIDGVTNNLGRELDIVLGFISKDWSCTR